MKSETFWTKETFHDWDTKAVLYAKIFDEELKKQNGMSRLLRVPCIKPKMHCLTHHLSGLARRFGCLGVMSEEGPERMQQPNGYVRGAHSNSLSLGYQIIDDIERIKLQSSKFVQLILAGIEQIRVANGKVPRKLFHCPDLNDKAIVEVDNYDEEILHSYKDV